MTNTATTCPTCGISGYGDPASCDHDLSGNYEPESTYRAGDVPRSWTVIHGGLRLNRTTRKWERFEEIIATGVSQAKADAIMHAHPDRHNTHARPER